MKLTDKQEAQLKKEMQRRYFIFGSETIEVINRILAAGEGEEDVTYRANLEHQYGDVGDIYDAGKFFRDSPREPALKVEAELPEEIPLDYDTNAMVEDLWIQQNSIVRYLRAQQKP